MPWFSVIIPVYNAERTLPAAVESVLKQTYPEWELIIVDDCFTDRSYELAWAYSEQDSRIRTIRLPQNSGNAKMPRDMGIISAENDYCLYIDSDDEIAMDYLQIMSRYLAENNVQCVLPTTNKKNQGRDDVLQKMPSNDDFRGRVFTGKDACRLTLPGWKVGCAGMVFQKDLYMRAMEENPYYFMCSDEFTERLILYYAPSVIISEADYT